MGKRREPLTLRPQDEITYILSVDNLNCTFPLPLLWYIANTRWLGGSEWLVRSKDPKHLDHFYEVNPDINWCSCPQSTHHGGCLHLMAVKRLVKNLFGYREESNAR